MKTQEPDDFKVRFKRAFYEKKPFAVGFIFILVVLVAVLFAWAMDSHGRAERAERMSGYYQNQYYQGLKEAEIRDMTARDSYEYAVKMFNIDVGRYLYQDLRVIGFVLAVGIMLGLTFHGFKLVYVRRNG